MKLFKTFAAFARILLSSWRRRIQGDVEAS
jgi:hypothetical protein